MTIGIYLLSFNNTDKVYIGKSLNIEGRFSAHKYYFNKGEGSKKLQAAFLQYGTPILNILEKCGKEFLDTLEIQYIEEFDAINNGFNTAKGGSSTGNTNGLDSYRTLYDKDTYYNIALMLTDSNNTHKHIADIMGVSKNVVQQIGSLSTHEWLREEYPNIYSKLEYICSITRNAYIHSSNRSGIVISPEGVVYRVENVESFAKEHGLVGSLLHMVLYGDRCHHKGWHIGLYDANGVYPEVLAPDGTKYSIPLGKAKEFAHEHGITQSSIQRLLKGTIKSHKGWVLSSRIIDLQKPI